MLVLDKKREAIIEGAIKRFIHYGIQKTTMNEIAEDLSVSKPSLYYYFPDKSSLIEGVIEKIFSDYFEAVQKDLYTDITLEERFAIFTDIRFKFFQKYYMLHLSGVTPDASLNSDTLKATFMSMKKKNIDMYTDILKRSVEKAEIAEVDLEKTAELYLESMMGITSLCIMHGNKELFPSKKEMKIILEKQHSLSRIFVKGLK
ncbi:MAG: TetR/AcrR family transcriptional regulator [Flavobacterium sp.]|nr:MAG: TetR/AcrR family transcriptional regulator [Flavobacterium sp.]